MTKSTVLFWGTVCALTSLGGVLGYRLSGISGLRTYKLVNAGGLILALLGVLVLSEMLATDWWKTFCVRWLAPAILWTHTTIPIGSFAGAFIAQFTHKPSASVVAIFSLEYWGSSVLALGPFNELVVFPQFPCFKKDVETRWRWMGFFLVIAGVLAQLVAAIMDITG